MALQCQVVSATQSLFEGEVQMVIAMGIGGELGVMAGHIPLITLLKPGVLRCACRMAQKKCYMYLAG